MATGFGSQEGLHVQLCKHALHDSSVLFTLWAMCGLPPGVVQGEISTKVQGPLCDSFQGMLRLFTWLDKVLPEAFCEVLSRF